MISWTLVGSAIRATPPSARMSAGTRSSAMTATAPASSAILACSAVVTSMMTPPLSISARPDFTRNVPVSLSISTPESASSPQDTARRLETSAGSELDGRGGVVGEQLDPGLAGREEDLLPLPVQELGGVALLVPVPSPLDD